MLRCKAEARSRSRPIFGLRSFWLYQAKSAIAPVKSSFRLNSICEHPLAVAVQVKFEQFCKSHPVKQFCPGRMPFRRTPGRQHRDLNCGCACCQAWFNAITHLHPVITSRQFCPAMVAFVQVKTWCQINCRICRWIPSVFRGYRSCYTVQSRMVEYSVPSLLSPWSIPPA